ncbi:D-alanine--D-alanine ligase [Mycoavidus cysteinexigens]|uniref:D-alanine--D-alanine ligase n=1 Tax=Mycoavidus cysteinexigens TaxID=1553431 RepID=A0A2Z6EXN4_9BURK|nr:D-alanine--D-alanine ligase [Mycoavidus cysteinexigens]BBE10201.1 D-alanine--D-alanine ligase [Mycoavidus cysteinexigens]GAM53437.1 D-alanine--D-alanine ligase [bacterium endosymbiont of Mortierella elongata FMR23-6]GLR00618.1 D-alanine--D-alanine ligase [Mycoavidus cysteinexigens]
MDPKIFGKVAVLYGGTSAERDVSLNSGGAVLAALRARGVDAWPFDPRERSLFALKEEGFTRVVNMLHGGDGENGALQGALQYLGIPYTGSGVLGCALAMDKVRSKSIWRDNGIPTPPFAVVMRGENYAVRAQEIVTQLGLPIFVKAAHEGSSIAIVKVKTADRLAAALEEVARHESVVLAEKGIEGGGEYTVSIVEGLDLPIIKIIPAGEFYDYHAKYIAEDTQYIIPCGLAGAEEKRLQKLALHAFKVLGCNGWGRLDFMLDANRQAWFLEVNTAPGMTSHSLVPKSAAALGLSYEDLVWRILSLTLA